MRILGLPCTNMPQAYYRVGGPLEAIARNSEHQTLVTLAKRYDQFKDYDWALCQPYADPAAPGQIAYLQKWGLQIAIDLDDDPFSLPVGSPANNVQDENWMLTQGGLGLIEALQFSDRLLVPTPALVERYSAYAQDIRVVPSQVDVDKWDKVEPIEHPGQLWLGYMGAPTHFDDLGLIYGAVRAFLNASPDHRFVMVGIDNYHVAFPEHLQARILSVPWSNWIVHYRRWVKAFDIALAPLQPTKFNEAKSDIKMLEYGLARLPVVASPTVYRDTFEYVSPLYASSFVDWIDQVLFLAENESLRRTRGDELRAYVEVYRTYDRNWGQWVEALSEDRGRSSFVSEKTAVESMSGQSPALQIVVPRTGDGQRESVGAEDLVGEPVTRRRRGPSNTERHERRVGKSKEPGAA
jgi:glycosyltransferase involved in cell wall biosynthesis